jgi:cell division protein FtsQ
MWFNDNHSESKRKRGNRRIVPVHQPLLMVHARVLDQKKDRMHKTGAIALLMVVLAAAVWVGTILYDLVQRKLFTECPRFVIKQLDLSSDGKLQSWHIKEYAGLEEGMNLFAVDMDKICKDLASVPIVSTVKVNRKLPDTLVIRITERVAVARLGSGSSGYFLGLDRDGYVLGPSSITPNLPTITGLKDKGLRPGSRISDPEVMEALKVLDACDSITLSQMIRIKDVNVTNPEYLNLTLTRGENVLLSRDNIENKLQKLARILQSTSKKGIALASIDMTVDKNFPGKQQ